jgi:hypothetical protein
MIVVPNMMSSVIPARLEYQCGHAALVSLPRIKGESSAQRNERVTREKSAAQTRACDFCGPTVEMVHVAAPPVAVVEPPTPAVAAPVVEETVVVPVVVAPAPAVNGHVVPEPVVAEEQPAVNGHVVPEPVVADEEPQATVRVVTVKPKVTRRPRIVTPKETAAPEPTPPVVIATKPRVIATKPRVSATKPRVSVTKPRVQQPRPVTAAALRHFTISYRVEQVLTAADIRDALRQVTALGATNIIAITRQ